MGPPSGSKRKRGTQARGDARRVQLLDAASELLRDTPPEDLSIADIAAKAGIPAASVYHFYANTAAVYAALGVRFAEDLNALLEQPYIDAEAVSWQSIIETGHDRAMKLYNDRPDYRRLILGGTAPGEIKLSDRENDEEVGAIMIGVISRHFVMPDVPGLVRIFFHGIQISDVMMMVSQLRDGYITPDMSKEAARAMVAYLRLYLPEILPRQTQACQESESD